MIDKATLMASIVAAAGQAAGDRAPAPSASKGVPADALRPSAKTGEARGLSPVQQRLEEETGLPAAPRASDLWRSRFDSETLKMFTEVLDPFTRDAVYRIPPGRISESAEREGERLAHRERLERDLALVV